jgi:hypothetical protein
MLNWILILLGIVLTQAALLYYRFSDRARGYMWLAVKWIWPFFLYILFIETVIAAALTELGLRYIPLPRPLLSILIGVLAVLLPNTFEYLALFNNLTEKKLKMRLKNPLVKALRWLNLAIVNKFGAAIRTRMEQDVFDLLAEFGPGIDRDEMGRRIRRVYCVHAQEIARKRNQPELMKRDAGFYPFEQLYVLAEHLGRKRLRQELMNPPDIEWDGVERRRRRKGTKADRLNPDDQKQFPSRFYDNDDDIKQIGDGQD